MHFFLMLRPRELLCFWLPFSDCSLPLLLQHLWDFAVVSPTLYSPPNPYGRSIRWADSQVPLVCCLLPDYLLPLVAVVGFRTLRGRMAGAGWSGSSVPDSSSLCGRYQHHAVTKPRPTAQVASELGLLAILAPFFEALGWADDQSHGMLCCPLFK